MIGAGERLTKKKLALILFWPVLCFSLFLLFGRKVRWDSTALHIIGGLSVLALILLPLVLHNPRVLKMNLRLLIGALPLYVGFFLGLALFDFWPYALLVLPMAGLLVGLVLDGKNWIDFLKKR